MSVQFPEEMLELNAGDAGVDLEAVRFALANSPRYQLFARAEQRDLPILVIAKHGTIPLHEWTIRDCVEAKAWIDGEREYPPEALERYFDGLRRAARAAGQQ